MIIEKNEIQNLMQEIQSISSLLKINEIQKDYTSACINLESLDKLIKSYINSANASEDYKKWLKVLSSSYSNKKSEYEFHKLSYEKTLLVKNKMAEKYLGKKKILSNEDNQSYTQNNITNISEYEIVQSSSNLQGIIKEILEDCKSLIKYYEIQSANLMRISKNIKQVQTYESFYVYDYQNTTVNISPYTPLIEKYIEEVKKIKQECENILESELNLDPNKIKSIEKEIKIIKEEFQKLYPKFQNLKEILEKNNLVKTKSKV